MDLTWEDKSLKSLYKNITMVGNGGTRMLRKKKRRKEEHKKEARKRRMGRALRRLLIGRKVGVPLIPSSQEPLPAGSSVAGERLKRHERRKLQQLTNFGAFVGLARDSFDQATASTQYPSLLKTHHYQDPLPERTPITGNPP